MLHLNMTTNMFCCCCCLSFAGGKPYTVWTGHARYNESTSSQFPLDACAGQLGAGDSPLAPDGTRNLRLDQPFWRTLSITDTHAYIVNPARVERVLSVLDPTQCADPVDICYSDAMPAVLRVYTPTQPLCNLHDRTQKWEGWHSLGDHHVYYGDVFLGDLCDQ